MSQSHAYLRGMLAPKHDTAELELQRRGSRHRGIRARRTPAEAILWRQLQRSRFHGRKFRRQHSVGPYVLDFYCPEEKLAVELDSAAHDHDGAARREVFRTTYLAAAGVRVVRFESRDVVRDLEGVLASIARCCSGQPGRVHVLSDEDER